MISPTEKTETVDAPVRRDARRGSLSVELSRKALHVLFIVLPLSILLLGKVTSLWLLIPAALCAVAADIGRSRSDTFSSAIQRIFGFMMRPEEVAASRGDVKINGATWVLVSLAIVTLVFPVDVAVPTFILFMIGDAAAAIVGRVWGKTRWFGESSTLEGSLAFFVAAAGVVLVYPITPILAGLLVAAVSTVAEALPGPFNDNVRVPFVAAGCLYLLGIVPPGLLS